MDTTKIEEKSEELILGAIDFIEKSGSFVAEQAPLVVKEFLTYRFVEAIAIVAASLLGILFLTIVCWVFHRLGVKRWRAWEPRKQGIYLEGSPDGWAAVAIISVLSWFAAVPAIVFPVTIPYAQDALQIYLAPRVYLIEELPKLLTD